MQFRNVLAVAALAGSTLAANTSNNSTLTTATPAVTKACSFSDFTATASDEVAQVAACATAVGDITIYGPAFGNVELTGVEQIYGSLDIINATQAVVLNAPTLQLVSGTLNLDGNTILATLNLAQLTTVGTLVLNALPALEKTGLTAGITSAENITVSDTALISLEGINVYELAIFNVNNNKDIETIDSGLQSVTNLISISYNAEKVDVSLDKLTTANQVYFQSINSLSAANLTSVNDSLTLTSNSIDKIEFKKLTSIGKSLTINKNDNLEELDFPALTKLGGALVISDNSQLSNFDGFPNLTTIAGTVTLDGKFNNGTFDSLNRVSGGFNLTSTGELSCSAFDKANKFTVEGNELCSGAKDSTSSSGTKIASDSSSETGSSSSSSATSTHTSSSKKNDGSSNAASRLTALIASFMAVGVAFY
ncbi:cell surface GPI-anchored protein ECM33 [[Candida] anglica]|uniref:Cell surface GPI-anchored protein ECM33 n=1 Tax=[Candida] anglica TaxID=148631 RepID=A0ABP0EL81_9ASCO